MHAWRARWLALIAALLVACSADATDAGAAKAPARVGNGCVLPPGISGSPRSIEDVMSMLDALPKPTSIPCFIDALDRPLRMQAVLSIFSAQPADGARSPRVFLFAEPLIMSVAPANIGKDLLEMSVLQSDRRTSVKAELEFPLTEPLATSAPYEHVQDVTGGTRCAACHREERRVADIGGTATYASVAYQPRFQDVEVGLATLEHEARECDPAQEPERCSMLHALFDGPYERAVFPSELANCF